MGKRLPGIKTTITSILLFAALFLLADCNSTQHLQKNQYLLRKNRVSVKSDTKISGRVALKDAITRQILQKPNTNGVELLPFPTPIKLWWYNKRYKKFHNRPDTSLPKYTERPVLLDTALMHRTAQLMKTTLFNQGFYYAVVKDTFKVSHHKAYVSYDVHTGLNYTINQVNYYIDDSDIARIVKSEIGETILKKGREFTYPLTADERSRLTELIRNNGYYRFNQANISFLIDTVDKSRFKHVESPFENAVSFISKPKKRKKPTLDIDLFIRLAEDSLAFTKYHINSVTVYPDFKNSADLRDTNLTRIIYDSVTFKYHRRYVHSKVLYDHIYLNPGTDFAQENYDKTQAKLIELGIFQYARLQAIENRRLKGIIDYNILLYPTKRYDFSTIYELSSGSTYALGHSVGISLHDKNFMKGANLLSIGVNGGIELSPGEGKNIFSHLSVLTEYYGINASIDFPKFLAPIAASLFDNSNLPHTILGVGRNVINRVDYFTLVNNSGNFSYSWRQTKTKTWSLSPVFVNIISLPVQSDSFSHVLARNDYLKNSYKENFIEGESISFTFDDMAKKHAINYSYLKVGLEEAGAILGGINQLGVALNDLYKIKFAQYTKFDFDARHYFTLRHTVFAFRFTGGVGIPYGQSEALPYIKQYFSGGPYSLRGWRIRTLGPGSYYNPSQSSSNQIDRTGDIKLELNGEYRFPIAPLFGGAIKMNGAIFADAGNIWLARKDTAYKGGEFSFNTLGQDIAADIGAGTRFDIASFLTLRLDVAIPVKKPYVHQNSGWDFNMNFNDPSWRSNNVIVNVSIGYPF
jgi:outer membrane protein insertion porin family